jgi:hypothetical protein
MREASLLVCELLEGMNGRAALSMQDPFAGRTMENISLRILRASACIDRYSMPAGRTTATLCFVAGVIAHVSK